VQVCSIDTLKNRAALLPPPALVIWDECHHLGAAGWRRVQEMLLDAYHVGLSATPQRLDGKPLDAHFDDIVLGPQPAWLIEQGHLSGYRAYAPSAPDMTGVRKQMGDFTRGEAEKRADTPKLTGDAIKHWQKYARGLRSVGFAVTVAHSQHLAEQFRGAGIPAAHLDGSSHKSERERIIRDFADGQLQVLFNVDLFGEGFDMAAISQRDVTIDCVMQMRPTQSVALHLQQLGRALRPAQGKTAILLDHAGNIQRHGLPDDDREWSLEGRDGSGKAANDNSPPLPVTCDECFGQIRRPLPPECPYCGYRLASPAGQIEVADGDLVEITEAQKQEMRRQRSREEAGCRTLEDWSQLAAARGYKQGWANKRYELRRRRA